MLCLEMSFTHHNHNHGNQRQCDSGTAAGDGQRILQTITQYLCAIAHQTIIIFGSLLLCSTVSLMCCVMILLEEASSTQCIL